MSPFPVRADMTVPTNGLASTSIIVPSTQLSNWVTSGEIITISPFFMASMFLFSGCKNTHFFGHGRKNVVFSPQPCCGLGAASPRARFFFDLSPIVLRLFFDFETKNNRRTNEEQTENKKPRHEAGEKGWQRDGNREAKGRGILSLGGLS